MNDQPNAEITARDDGFHFADMSDRWWITETAWFSFCKPERKIGGWIYNMFRPNIGTVAGGAWVWEHWATTLGFWGVAGGLWALARHVYRRTSPHFADVL